MQDWNPMIWAYKMTMIDFFFYVVIFLAVVHGWRKGLISGLFSMICGLIGLAAAVKLSAVLATHVKSGLHMTSRWLPVFAFIIVFLVVILVIRWIGALLEKMTKLVLLGWLNKLGGILLFLVLYLSVYSIVLFYGTKTQVISKQAEDSSHFYAMIASFGPTVIRSITGFLPFGQDMFTALEAFFDKIAHNIH
jgi:membrane protein required for colicin V production